MHKKSPESDSRDNNKTKINKNVCDIMNAFDYLE